MVEQTTSEKGGYIPSWIAVFLNNPGTTIAALVGAVGIWFYVQGRIEGTQNLSASLDFSVQEGYVITTIKDEDGKEITGKYDINLQGPISLLERIKNQNLKIAKQIPAPPEQQEQKTFEIEITEADLNLSSGEFPLGVHMNPRTTSLKVHVEKLVNQDRALPVSSLEEKINYFTMGSPREDYRITDVSTNFSSVTLSGPVSEINDTRIVLASPVDVNNKASNQSKQVRLTTDPPRNRMSIEPEEITVTVSISSKMTERTIRDQLLIGMDEELHTIFQERGLRFQPEDGKVEITFRVPKNVKKESLKPNRFHPVLIIPSLDLETLQNPVASARVSTDNIRVFIDPVMPNRDRIEVVNIKPDSIKFKPKD